MDATILITDMNAIKLLITEETAYAYAEKYPPVKISDAR